MAAATNGDGDGLSVFIICRRLYSRKGCCCNRDEKTGQVWFPLPIVFFFLQRVASDLCPRAWQARGRRRAEGVLTRKAQNFTKRRRERRGWRGERICVRTCIVTRTCTYHIRRAHTQQPRAQSSFFLESYLWRKQSAVLLRRGDHDHVAAQPPRADAPGPKSTKRATSDEQGLRPSSKALGQGGAWGPPNKNR